MNTIGFIFTEKETIYATDMLDLETVLSIMHISDELGYTTETNLKAKEKYNGYDM